VSAAVTGPLPVVFIDMLEELGVVADVDAAGKFLCRERMIENGPMRACREAPPIKPMASSASSSKARCACL